MSLTANGLLPKTTMTIFLCAEAEEVDLRAVAAVLDHYALSSVPVLLKDLNGRLPATARRAVLILPRQDMVAVGERVSRVRSYIGEHLSCIVVCTQLRPADRREILACGASELVTPAIWRSASIAERILGELIALGDIQPTSFGLLRGATELMRKLYRDIGTVARLSDPALILGETGTGKELVAREIHRCSGRSGGLMAINCAALTPELLESELFGHERGAFSGAVASRRGLLAEAGLGTVFLDEIGDLAPSAQAKLLRVLEEKRVRPVGSNQWHQVQARIVLATHRDLEGAARSGAFRQDLYERIRGFTLHLPPLRERLADLVLLCQHFVEEYNQEYAGQRTIPGGALDPLFRYHWPGNVRELRQTLRKAAAFAESETGPISVLTLLDSIQRSPVAPPGSGVPFDPTTDSWNAVQERARGYYFRALLRETAGNKKLAAERAGVSRSQLYEILRQLGEDGGEQE